MLGLTHNFRTLPSGPLVDADIANFKMTRRLSEVANVRVHGELKERSHGRWQRERLYLRPYHGIVDLAPWPSSQVTIPVESLQHPLSVYAPLVMQP